MKWIFLFLLLLMQIPLCAETQYSQSQCDNIEQEREQIRKRLNAGYSAKEGEWLDRRDRELFQVLAVHCISPSTNTSSYRMTDDEDTESGYTSTERRAATSIYAGMSLQEMPEWSGANAIFTGDKAAAWDEFYQVPPQCRLKKLSETEFVACAEDKAAQKSIFEQKWQQLTFVPVGTDTALAQPSAQPLSIQPSHLAQPKSPTTTTTTTTTIKSIAAYTLEPDSQATLSAPSPTSVSATASPLNQTTASSHRYMDNIQQQFEWVGTGILLLLALGSWLIYRK
jgi:hypothetical protein